MYIAVAWLLIFLGIAGLVLPFLQGILFLAIGVYLLARESIWAKRQLVHLRKRYPDTTAKFTAVGQQARKTIKRFRQRE